MDFNFFKYFGIMKDINFLNSHSDLRSFVASTAKRRKKKPSWNQPKKKKKRK